MTVDYRIERWNNHLALQVLFDFFGCCLAVIAVDNLLRLDVYTYPICLTSAITIVFLKQNSAPQIFVHHIPIKPLTVNRSYQGRRFATPELKAFKQALGYLCRRSRSRKAS